MSLNKFIKSMYPLLFLLLGLSFSMPLHSMSLEKEIELGREEHKKIISQFGVYGDPELGAYVNKVGQRVAENSSRPEIEYTFTVINDDMVNAFALPGGFIYISRGMLMHMNSESELAAVLGHEVAHVTEKHAIRRQNRGAGLSVISTILAAVAGEPALMELGDIFGGVLLSGYSREFELDADRVGAQYMAMAGYSPDAMIKIIEILKAKDRIEIEQARLEKREPAVYHGFLATHPDNDKRYHEAIQESLALVEDYDHFMETDEFLERLNGLEFGKSKQVGVIRQQTFYYPRLGIKLRFPPTWRLDPQPRGIHIVNQVNEASLSISTSRFKRGVIPVDFVRDSLGYKIREGREITIAGMPTYLGIADRADTNWGPRPVRFAVIFDTRKRLAYVLRGAGKHDLSKIADDKHFIASIFSFDKMTKDDIRIAKRPKVQVVRAESDTTMEALAEESPISNYALERLRVMNGLYPDGQPEEGQLIKIIN